MRVVTSASTDVSLLIIAIRRLDRPSGATTGTTSEAEQIEDRVPAEVAILALDSKCARGESNTQPTDSKTIDRKLPSHTKHGLGAEVHVPPAPREEGDSARLSQFLPISMLN